MRPRCSLIFGSIRSVRITLRRLRGFSSSSPPPSPPLSLYIDDDGHATGTSRSLPPLPIPSPNTKSTRSPLPKWRTLCPTTLLPAHRLSTIPRSPSRPPPSHIIPPYLNRLFGTAAPWLSSFNSPHFATTFPHTHINKDAHPQPPTTPLSPILTYRPLATSHRVLSLPRIPLQNPLVSHRSQP